MEYSIQDFYAAREGSKSFLGDYASFESGKTYIFRFLVTRFVKDAPTGLWGDFIRGVSTFLAVDVPQYAVKGITLAKVPAGSKVIVYSGNTWFWEKPVLTFDSSWMIDVVVSPEGEVGMTWTRPSAWTAKIKSVLDAWKGASTNVYAMGVVELPIPFGYKALYLSDRQEQIFQNVSSYWSNRPAVSVVEACSETEQIEYDI
jgi:hypothetical protein